jgi:hypothetical protein
MFLRASDGPWQRSHSSASPRFAITTPQQHRPITLSPASASVLVPLNAAMSGIVGTIGIV